jgi:hypothetical protein
MICTKHRSYAAKRAPTGKCPQCWKMWWEALNESVKQSVEKVKK